MATEAGFDLVPPLGKGMLDKHKWHSFIEAIKERYQKDDRVKIKPNYIKFKAGDRPLLPFEGHKFLSFGSTISGSQSKEIKEYIKTVSSIAYLNFGCRVHCWESGVKAGRFYSKQAVDKSVLSYEQVGLLFLRY